MRPDCQKQSNVVNDLDWSDRTRGFMMLKFLVAFFGCFIFACLGSGALFRRSSSGGACAASRVFPPPSIDNSDWTVEQSTYPVADATCSLQSIYQRLNQRRIVNYASTIPRLPPTTHPAWSYVCVYYLFLLLFFIILVCISIMQLIIITPLIKLLLEKSIRYCFFPELNCSLLD